MTNLKSINIKGKPYVEVVERLRVFRESFADYSLTTEVVQLTPDFVVLNAVITDPTGRIVATGHAHEDRTSSMINKTSYVENCETSAFGRCLAALGIGIETSIASANEVQMAIAQQANLDDLSDRLGLVATYDRFDVATLKADFMALVEQLPEDQRFKYQDHKGMTPARYEKGIKFLQDQIAKYKKP